jgi:hypothetical protein
MKQGIKPMDYTLTPKAPTAGSPTAGPPTAKPLFEDQLTADQPEVRTVYVKQDNAQARVARFIKNHRKMVFAASLVTVAGLGYYVGRKRQHV